MRKILGIAILLLVFTGAIVTADVLEVNKSTIYKVDKDALWTTSLNMLTVITKHCVTNSTRIYLDNRIVRLSDLKPGMRVIVYYRADQCKTAVIIKAYSR